MPVNRRQMLFSLASAAVARSRGLAVVAPLAQAVQKQDRPLKRPDGSVDWAAVRELFPLRSDWTHLASFLFVSHPKPVARSIDEFRKKLDSDVVWAEMAALTDSEGRPYAAVKRALAEYVGGKPQEICMTSNTTGALAMAYHGLRI